MASLAKKVFRRGINLCKRVPRYTAKIYRHAKECVIKTASDKARIIYDLDRYYERVFRIKGETYETITLPETYNFSREVKIEAFSPAIDIYNVGTASVMCGSDIVRTKEGVVHDKVFAPLFPKANLRDPDLNYYDNTYIWRKKNNQQIYVNGGGVSLLGGASYLWSHFFIQFGAKLSFAKSAGLLKDNLTIILHRDTDPHVKELTENYLKPFDVNIIYADPDKVYCVERLYFISAAITYPNSTNYILPEDCIFPAVTKKAMKDFFVTPYEDILKDNASSDTPKKIYLARRATYRTLINWQEAEEFFISEGFTVVEPHKMTLQEKIKCFHGADFIAGPGASSFMNVIWCRPEAKILKFSNYPRRLESTTNEIANISGAKLMLVLGEDRIKEGCHSPYFIPIEKIKKAYSYMKNLPQS